MFQQQACGIIRSTPCFKQQHNIVWAQVEMVTKLQFNSLIVFISTTKTQHVSILNTFNSQACLEFTINLNNIPETRQTKTSFSLSSPLLIIYLHL